jgi:hypothetical protein
MPEKAIAHVGFWMRGGSKTHCTTRASVHFLLGFSCRSCKICSLFSRMREKEHNLPSLPRLMSFCQRLRGISAVAFHGLANTNLTFMIAANHLSQAVSQTPDYQMARSVRSTNTSNHDGDSRHYRAVDSAIEVEATAEGDADAVFHSGRGYTTLQRNSGRGPIKGHYSQADCSKLKWIGADFLSTSAIRSVRITISEANKAEQSVSCLKSRLQRTTRAN